MVDTVRSVMAVMEGLPDPPPSLARRLIVIMSEIGAMPKVYNQRLKYDIYEYPTILAAIRSACLRNGVMIFIEDMEIKQEAKPTANGGTGYHTLLLVQISFQNVDAPEDVREVTAWGEAFDSGDKSATKARTNAVKDALLKTFLISDRSTDEGAEPEEEPAPEPQQAAPQQLRPRGYNPEEPITARQLATIKELQTLLKLSDKQLNDRCIDLYAAPVSKLTGGQAFELIGKLDTVVNDRQLKPGGGGK